MISFADFFTAVKQVAVPEGVGVNVENAVRDYVVNGLMRTQTFIPCLKNQNVDFFLKASAKEFCGVDIINGPRGIIQGVYAFKPGADCKKYFYDQVHPDQINCWIEKSRCHCPPTTPPSYAIYDSPYCNYLLDADTACAAPYITIPEDDTAFKSACAERLFAKGPDNKLYLAPRFPCGYVVAVHWEGIKYRYNDYDAVPDDEDLISAVALFTEAHLAQKDRDIVSHRSLMDSYSEMMRDMAHRCRQERMINANRDCASSDAMSAFVNPLPENNPYYSDLGIVSDVPQILGSPGSMALQANNGAWYQLYLLEDEGIVTVAVTQTPVPDPGTRGYVVLLADDATRRKLSLWVDEPDLPVSEENPVTWITATTGEVQDYSSLVMGAVSHSPGTDLFRLTLITDEGDYTLYVDQTPV